MGAEVAGVRAIASAAARVDDLSGQGGRSAPGRAYTYEFQPAVETRPGECGGAAA